MKRAFTIVELLSVCVILAVLASFLMPVLMQAMRAARVSSDITKLKQLHIAFSLYRTEWDGDARYGTASEMGLPDHYPFMDGAWRSVLADPAMWKSPCGVHPDFQPEVQESEVHYLYPVCDQQAGCGDYYDRYQDSAMLLIDKQCIDPASPFDSPYHEKLLVGVRLNGQAKTLTTRSFPDDVGNWHLN